MPSPLAGVIKDVARLQQGVLKQAVDRFAELAMESAAVVVGNGGVMNMHTALGRRGVPMKTSPATYRGSGIVIEAIVRGKPGGPWVWIEDGTSAHDIRARQLSKKGNKLGRGKHKIAAGQRRRAMYGPGLPHPVYVVHHRGSTGRHAWTKAVANLDAEMSDVIDTELREVLRG
jgi:hypothetical protein